MATIIIAVNFIALAIGIITLVISYRFTRAYPLPYLNYYLYFIVCSVVSGFFDWILFSWAAVLARSISRMGVNVIYHIFWDIIGFPCTLFALYFLFVFLRESAGIKITLTSKRFMLFIIIALYFISLLHAFLYADMYYSFLGSILNMVYLAAIPFFQLLFLIYLYLTADRFKNSNGVFIKNLILVIIFSSLLWYTLIYMQFIFKIGNWSFLLILGFYASILFPTLFINHYLKKNANAQAFEVISSEKINPLLREFDFTDREKEIILLLYKGKSNKAIEEELFISIQTVKNYVSKIYKKLNLKNRLELVNFIRNKIS